MAFPDIREVFEEWQDTSKEIIRVCMIINQELSKQKPHYNELIRYLDFVVRDAKVLRKEIKKSKKMLV